MMKKVFMVVCCAALMASCSWNDRPTTEEVVEAVEKAGEVCDDVSDLVEITESIKANTEARAAK